MGRWVAVGAVCAIVAGCSAEDAGRTSRVRQANEDDAREYVRLVIALGARDPDSLDYAYPPSEWPAYERSGRPSLADIRDRARAAVHRLEPAGVDGLGAVVDSDHTDRLRHLVRQLKSVAARADILSGRRMSFDEESASLFGISLPPGGGGNVDRVYAELERLLPGAAPLSVRYASFEKRQVVPPDRAHAVFERALAGCRERTVQHLTLPPGERVEISPIHGGPWNAFSRYLGGYHSVIQVNFELGLTVDRALSLACHEGYPGHHAQNALVEARLVHGRGFIDFSVQPLFSPQALVAEGLAVKAVDLAFPGDTRADFERTALYPLAGLDGHDAGRTVQIERLVGCLSPVVADITRRYLDGDLEFVRAGSALSTRALVPNPDELLKFVNEFRSYAIAYTYGPYWVNDRVRLTDEKSVERERWRRYEAVATRPWTVFEASEPKRNGPPASSAQPLPQ